MNDDSSKDGTPASASASPPEGDDALRARWLWLFRDALRQQRVHPLMDLLRRYREEGTP